MNVHFRNLNCVRPIKSDCLRPRCVIPGLLCPKSSWRVLSVWVEQISDTFKRGFVAASGGTWGGAGGGEWWLCCDEGVWDVVHRCPEGIVHRSSSLCLSYFTSVLSWSSARPPSYPPYLLLTRLPPTTSSWWDFWSRHFYNLERVYLFWSWALSALLVALASSTCGRDPTLLLRWLNAKSFGCFYKVDQQKNGALIG